MWASAHLAFQVEDDPFEVGVIQDGLVLGGAQQQGVATQIVDLAGDALGVIVDARDEALAEELILAPGDVEVMFDIARGLLQVEGFEVEADGDALVEGLVEGLIGGKAELVGQHPEGTRLSEQDQGDEGGGVHVAVEQETQLVEQLRRQQVGFVDDEEDVATLAGQILKGGAELGQEAHEAKSGLDLKGEEDFAVEGGNGEVGVGQVDDGVDVVVQGLGEGAGGGRFAGADVADEEGVKLPTAKRGFVLLPRRWVVERSLAWMTRFRRLVCDYERLAETLVGLHFVAFPMLLAHRFVTFMVQSS